MPSVAYVARGHPSFEGPADLKAQKNRRSPAQTAGGPAHRMRRSLFRICAFGTYGGEKIGQLPMMRTLFSCLLALAVTGVGVRLSSAFDQKTAYEQALEKYQSNQYQE